MMQWNLYGRSDKIFAIAIAIAIATSVLVGMFTVATRYPFIQRYFEKGILLGGVRE